MAVTRRNPIRTMSSLQEQLLKAGLVDDRKLDRTKQEKDRKARQTRKKHGKSAPPPAASGSTAAEKKARHDRELNRKRQEEAKLRERAAQAQDLIDRNKQDRSKGEQPYSFVYRKKIKKIYVTEEQKRQLVGGQLAIATWVAANDGRKFELVPRAVAEKILQRDESFVVDLGESAQAATDENDPYADYKVPDDLTW